MQEPLQKTAFSKQALLHCAGIVGAGLLYSLGINLFVVPAGLYTGGIMGFAQQLRKAHNSHRIQPGRDNEQVDAQ